MVRVKFARMVSQAEAGSADEGWKVRGEIGEAEAVWM